MKEKIGKMSEIMKKGEKTQILTNKISFREKSAKKSKKIYGIE